MKPTKALNKPYGIIYGAKWAGHPCEARVVWITVGIAPEGWWCENLIGENRLAIEVAFNDQVVYIDNHDGWALRVFLKGLAPLPKFRFLPLFEVLATQTGIDAFYKASPA